MYTVRSRWLLAVSEFSTTNVNILVVKQHVIINKVLIKSPLATARAASCIGPVRLFVCLSPNCKKVIFSKTKQFRAMVSIEDL